MVAVAALMAACDEYTLPNPPAQSNNQEPVFRDQRTVRDRPHRRQARPGDIQSEQHTARTAPLQREQRSRRTCHEVRDGNLRYRRFRQIRRSGNNQRRGQRGKGFRLRHRDRLLHNILPQPRSCDSLYPLCRIREQHSPAPRTCVWAAPTTIWAPQPSPSLPCCWKHTVENAYYLVGSFNGWQIASAQLMQKDEEGNPSTIPTSTPSWK